jgi:hypothetical protein
MLHARLHQLCPAGKLVSNVTLFIPSLVPPAPVDLGEPVEQRHRALEHLLARSHKTSEPCSTVSEWLCTRFNVPRQLDWPAAPLSVLGEGEPPGTGYWLRATPVHLRVQRDELVLIPLASAAVSAAESQALLDTLNRHFAPDGLQFVAPHPQRWYLRLPSSPDLYTVSLEEATGRDIDDLLPTGDDRLRYHRLFNEVQMVLHDHPVNERREAADLLPVNSVWFGEGGVLPPQAPAPWTAAVGDVPLLRGLGQRAGVPVAPLSAGPAVTETGELLVVLAEVDPASWAERVKEIEREWLGPLLRRLRSGKVARLGIATVHGGQVHQWTITRRDLWKFWRPVRPLLHQVGTART